MRITDGRIRIIKAAEPEKIPVERPFLFMGAIRNFKLVSVLIFVHKNGVFTENEQKRCESYLLQKI